MPGVNHGPNDQFSAFLGGLHNRVRAIETQQQTTLSNSLGQPLINFGLVPGSVPARYGMQFLDPATGAEIMFMGEASAGAQFDITGEETVTGTLNVTGDMIVGGTLSLPAGIINNAALASPVSGGYADGTLSPVTLVSTASTVTETIAIPSGFTRALVMATATAGMTATATGHGAVTAAVAINGTSGPTISSLCVDSGYMSASATFALELTGLSGPSITVEGAGGTTGTCAAGQGNVRISAIATFLR